jgi:hypothetical protein
MEHSYTINLPFPISVNRIWRYTGSLMGTARGTTGRVIRSAEYLEWIREADAMWLTQKQRIRPVMLGHHRVHMRLDACRRRADGHNLMKGVLDWLARVEIIHNDADTDVWSGEWSDAPPGCIVEITGKAHERQSER